MVTRSRRADAFEPGLRRREFRLQRQIDEIAGDRDVVRRLRLHVGDQRVEHLAAVIFVAVAGPVEIAERALAREIAKPRRGQRRQMRVGQMRQREAYRSFALRRIPCDIEPSHDHAGDTRIKRDGCPSEVCVTALQHLRTRLEPQLRRVFHLYWRMARGMTLGVRGVVLDGDNKVFLVRHSYVAGWHLPGGGVEVGETFLEALRRELVEEGRIELTGEPVLHGMFFNSHVSRRDHVAVYVVRQFPAGPPARAQPRDRRVRVLAANALPEETTRGTRLRIAEVLDGTTPIATWR